MSEMPKISCVYKIAAVAKPERFYIGSTVNLRNRSNEHLRGLRQNKHPNKFLQAHVNKHGINDIYFEILEACNRWQLIIREQYFVDALSPSFNMTNVVDNPMIGRKHSEETKRKMSIDRKGKRIGFKLSEEAKRKIGEAQKGNKLWLGRKHSPSSIDKMRQSHKGQRFNIGRKHTDEAIQKMSEARKNISPETRIKIGLSSKGRICKPETREKLRIAITGKKRTEETKKRLSESSKGKVFSEQHRFNISKSRMGNNYCVGRQYSEETKRKISNSLKKYNLRRKTAV